jgi:anaerobic ribonucleoside-triphosphate reductase activating protein
VRLNLARTLQRSAANGPGERFVLWVQGCPLACPGCWNPDTWAFERRDLRSVEDLAAVILATEGIEGVTFTGGEPFAQARALAAVAERVRAAGLSVFVFTGYDLDELTRPEHLALLAVTDVVVAGRYVEAERADGLAWRGSANQRVHFLSDRYGPAETEEVAEVEFHLGADGTLTVTGFPTAHLVGEELHQALPERL